MFFTIINQVIKNIVKTKEVDEKMIVQNDFLNKLKDFGLNSYESKLWTALLSRGVSTAGELSDIANVPRSRSYDVLESLEKKGFILMKLGKPIKYIAVPPEEVLERVKKRVVAEADTKTKILDKVKKSKLLDELNLLHTQGIDLVDPTDFSGTLKSRNNIYNHLETLIKNSTKSIIIMTSEKGLLRKHDSLKKALTKAKERGVSIKVAAPITKENEDTAKSFTQFAEVRNTEDKARFALIDGKELTFMLLDDEKVHPSYDVGVWVNNKMFASVLEGMFSLFWQKMKPFNSRKK